MALKLNQSMYRGMNNNAVFLQFYIFYKDGGLQLLVSYNIRKEFLGGVKKCQAKEKNN